MHPHLLPNSGLGAEEEVIKYVFRNTESGMRYICDSIVIYEDADHLHTSPRELRRLKSR